MSSEQDLEPVVRTWLQGNTRALPDRVRHGVLVQVAGTSQRRRAWGFPALGNGWRWLATAALILGVGVVGMSAFSQPGPASPLPSPAPPVTGQTSDAVFALTIGADHSRYAVDSPITITTELRYIGTAETTTVTSAFGGVVAFNIEQLDGPIDAWAGRRMSCTQHDYHPGDVESVPFAKSGGWSAEDPMADFWRGFFADPELRLPAGRYRISAEASYGVTGCGDEHTLVASVDIVVGRG